MVVGAEERVQQEQLAEYVGEVQEFGGQVEHDQVVAVPVAADHAKVLGEEVLQEHTTTAPILTLVVQIVVHVADHVLDRLVASFWVQGVLDRLGSFHEVVDVNSGSVAEYAPEQARDVEEKCLDQ